MYTIPLNHNKTVLRNGFVKLIDCMPRVIPNEAKPLMCDSAVVQAARVSYNTGLKDVKSDTKLIRYLVKNRHTSPFEMVKFKFHVKAPIFVTRQWFRHRMGNYNEVSGRYTKLNDEFYYPTKVSSQSSENKQLSSDDNLLVNTNIKISLNDYLGTANDQHIKYKNLIDMGVSREIARIGLPLNLLTEFYWTIDLHNLLGFIKLRDSEHAQHEIREYASNIKELITDICPITIKAYDDYLNNNVTFYSNEMDVIKVSRKVFCENNLSNKENDELDIKINKFNKQQLKKTKPNIDTSVVDFMNKQHNNKKSNNMNIDTSVVDFMNKQYKYNHDEYVTNHFNKINKYLKDKDKSKD